MPVGEFDYAKRLIPIYQRLYKETLQLLVDYDPCHVVGGVCERARRKEGTNFCCSGCKYLGPAGCTVQALQCKLWVCHYDYIPENIRQDFQHKMWKIMIEAERLNLLVTRGSMEDSIAHACSIYMETKEDKICPIARAPKSSIVSPVAPTMGFKFEAPPSAKVVEAYSKPKAKPSVFKATKTLEGVDDYV